MNGQLQTDRAAKSALAPGDRPRVLYVCANERIRQMESRVLGAAGCECVGIASLTEAALSGVRGPFAFVLADSQTAWSDGTLLRKLRLPELSETPIALLAERDIPTELIESCFAAGVHDCLLRPLQVNQVKARADASGSAARPAPRSTRETGCAVLLYGERAPQQERLRRLLELSGYYVYERSVAEGLRHPPLPAAPPVGLMLLRWGPNLLSDLLKSLRAEAALAHVPAILVSSHLPDRAASPGDLGLHSWLDESRAQASPERVLQEVNAALQATANLRVQESVPFFCPVEFREWGTAQSLAWTSGFSSDVSSGGLFVQTLVPTRPRVALELRIHLTTTHEEVTATGVVAWSHAFGHSPEPQRVGMGVEFLGVPLSKRLAQLINACRPASPAA